MAIAQRAASLISSTRRLTSLPAGMTRARVTPFPAHRERNRSSPRFAAAVRIVIYVGAKPAPAKKRP